MASAPVSNHMLDRLSTSVIEKPEDKTWNENISATASTEGFWDQEFQIKVAVNENKRKFHQTRYLRAKHLPADVTQAEVRQMLSDFPVSQIKLTTALSTAAVAAVYLEDPEMLEEWDKNRRFVLRGQRIPVHPTPTEMLLCVARLPLTYTEAQFTALCKSFGEVQYCFLMISEKTGESKGYGFVEYCQRDKAILAKNKLQGWRIYNPANRVKRSPMRYDKYSNGARSPNPEQSESDGSLWVEFVDPHIITFESLQSKCLYVSNLPSNYCDMADFRKRFSEIVTPPYCHIAMKYGCALGWGLVEFNCAKDAEMTFYKMNNAQIRDKKIRVDFHVPGVRAIHLYVKLLSTAGQQPPTKGHGLLPAPPAPAIYETVKNLRKQNPLFALNVESILASERIGNGGNEPSSSGAEDSNSHRRPIPRDPVQTLISNQNRSPSPLLVSPLPPTPAGYLDPTVVQAAIPTEHFQPINFAPAYVNAPPIAIAGPPPGLPLAIPVIPQLPAVIGREVMFAPFHPFYNLSAGPYAAHAQVGKVPDLDKEYHSDSSGIVVASEDEYSDLSQRSAASQRSSAAYEPKTVNRNQVPLLEGCRYLWSPPQENVKSNPLLSAWTPTEEITSKLSGQSQYMGLSKRARPPDMRTRGPMQRTRRLSDMLSSEDSEEHSLEEEYIGQHAQGLGGRYCSSIKRQRKI